MALTPEHATVKFDGREIEYTIIRSARRKKTIELSLDPQIGIVVRSPSSTPLKEISGFVNLRIPWLRKHATEEILCPTQRRFTDDETLPYLGKEIPIITQTIHDLSAPIAVSLEQDSFHITVPAHIDVEQRPAACKQVLERWYRKEAGRFLPLMVERWQHKVSRKKPSRVLIRNQRRRWGSCSSDGSIRLNWRLIMTHPDLIEYVVVHELAHLEVMNHSPQFWQQVENALPEYKERRQRLNKVGIHLWWI